MIGARYARPFATVLLRVANKKWYTVTSVLQKNIATISRTATNEIPVAPSRYTRQEKASTFVSRNVANEKDIDLCTREYLHSRNDVIHETSPDIELPQYLRRHYWWAYISPTMISILDRKWLVDIVLWGNFTKLRDAAVNELLDSTQQITQNRDSRCSSNCGTKIQGKVLQISSVYADLTETIVEKLARDATLDVIDVVPAQLNNLQQKLQRSAASNDEDIHNVSLTCCDASDLSTHFPSNNTFDKVLIFFLLHETPTEVRQKVLAEACRVVKHDGKIVIIDYHKPNTALWRYIMQFMYRVYEPFAIDLWNHPLSHWLPHGNTTLDKETYFGGLYQKLVIKTGSK
jgi:ubiquinone/menaquinone biosynthesis C-methylase UbiE